MSGVLNVLLGSGGVPSPFLYNGTLTVGQYIVPLSPTNVFYGLLASPPNGSLSPTSSSITDVLDYVDTSLSQHYSIIQVTSLTDPGAASITSVVANGVTLFTSAATYSYAGTTANWTWPNGTYWGLNGFSVGGTTALLVF